MAQDRRTFWRWPLLAALAIAFLAGNAANAEPRTVRIATQYGISYLQLLNKSRISGYGISHAIIRGGGI